MDTKHSWKRMEDIEVDIIDLLYKLCMKWKQILLCALFFTILLGGYGWIKNTERQADSGLAASEGAELNQEERAAVEEAVLLAHQTEELKEYIENSVLMQINAYRKNRVLLLFGIDNASWQTLPKITENYLSYITNGGIIDTLKERNADWNVENRYLSELISAWKKTDDTESVMNADASMQTGTLLYVEVLAKENETALNLAQDIQSILEEYEKEVRNTCGNHHLSLISSEKSVRIDHNLLSVQNEKHQLLKANTQSLKEKTDAFSRDQRAVYEAMAENGTEEEKDVSKSRINVKYIVLGCMAGIGIYCVFFVLLYLLKDTVKSSGEFKRYYTIPFYGSIPLGKKRVRGKESVLDYRAVEHAQERILKQVRLYSRKTGMQKFCLTAGFMPDSAEQAIFDELSAKLQKWGIEAVPVADIVADISRWDDIVETGNVLMFFRIGITTHRMIDEEMEFYMENGISVIGAVAFESR